MTTGAPIYLVSACSSGEEFVAAFRRYADRNGVVFVPIAEPLPAGTKARFALTLVDGGVMLEGDGEVVSSAKTPSVLYGRTGMTVKLLAPDEPSKTLLAELEKARLAAKPQPPSVAPRPASVPAEPRPQPPAPGGRIDAVNALAECVAIGEVTAPAAATSRAASPRITVPSIPPKPAAANRPVTAPMPTISGSGSSSGAGTARPRTPTKQPTPAGGTSTTSTTLGMTPLAKPSTTKPLPTAVPPRPKTPTAGTPTTLGMAPLPKASPTEILAAATPGDDPTTRVNAATIEPVLDNDEPTDLTTIPIGAEGTPELMSTLAKPTAPARREPRKTELGVAVAARDDAPPTEQMPAIPADAVDEDEQRPTVQMAAVTIEEQTPSGDWTMVPGSDGPTIVPTPRPEKKAPAGPPTGDFIIALDPTRPDGWSEPATLDKRAESPRPGPPVSAVASERPLDSNANVDRDIEPELGPKVQIDPTLIEPLQEMPADDSAAASASMSAAASASISAAASASIPRAYPSVADDASYSAIVGQSPSYAVEPAREPALPPSRAAYEAIRLPASTGDATSLVTVGSRRRTTVIAISAGAVLLLGLGLVFAFSGDKDKSKATRPSSPEPAASVPPPSTPEPTDTPSPAVAAPTPELAEPSDSTEPSDNTEPSEEPEAPSARAVAPTAPTPSDDNPALASTTCVVDVSSTPSGAEIVLDGNVVGTTPTALPLPCGVDAKLTFKKSRYLAQTRTVTPNPQGTRPVKVGLARATYSVKVSSSPVGATITLDGKVIGVTPTTVKLPAFETSTLKISKPGYAVDTRKVTPKANNLSVHATLKKGR